MVATYLGLVDCKCVVCSSRKGNKAKESVVCTSQKATVVKKSGDNQKWQIGRFEQTRSTRALRAGKAGSI